MLTWPLHRISSRPVWRGGAPMSTLSVVIFGMIFVLITSGGLLHKAGFPVLPYFMIAVFILFSVLFGLGFVDTRRHCEYIARDLHGNSCPELEGLFVVVM